MPTTTKQPMPSTRTLAERFWEKVQKADGCWLWTGCINSHGYGGIGVNGKHVPAHRVGYELVKGPIPTGLEIDHLCRNRQCVNPDHLDVVDSATNTHRGNARSGVNSRKQFCIHGHDAWLHYIGKNGRHHRSCRTCTRDRLRVMRRRLGIPERVRFVEVPSRRRG